MKEDKLKEAVNVLGEEIVNKVLALSDKATDAFLEKVEELIEKKRLDKKANERKPTKEEILRDFTGFGYEIPKGAEFYKVSEHASKRGHSCYGMKVGQYTHSCHIDTTDLTVLLLVDGTEHWVDSFADLWIDKIFTT